MYLLRIKNIHNEIYHTIHDGLNMVRCNNHLKTIFIHISKLHLTLLTSQEGVIPPWLFRSNADE